MANARGAQNEKEKEEEKEEEAAEEKKATPWPINLQDS